MMNAREIAITSLVSAIVGALTGLVYVALVNAMNIASGVHGIVASLSAMLTVPLSLCGGLVTGFILKHVSSEVAGPGIDAAISAIVRRWGWIDIKTTISKFVATVSTVGMGASGGLVGPMAQIGAGIGSFVSTVLGLNQGVRKKIALVGLGAGIASVLQAPVSGALACMEILYRGPGLEGGVLVPSLFAAFSGSIVTYLLLGGWYSRLRVAAPHALLLDTKVLLCSLIIGVAGGILSRAFSKMYFSLEGAFQKLKLPLEVKPAIGCAIAACIALAYPQVYGTGWNLVWLAMSAPSVATLTYLLIAKMLATAFTLSSGGSGGIFAPTIAMGALVGAIVSTSMGLQRYNELMVLVGISSLLSGLCRIPLAAVVLVAEVAGGLYALPPAIVASLVSYVVAGPKATIYKSQLEPTT